MAMLAKILGVICLATAAADVALGLYVYYQASNAMNDSAIGTAAGAVYLAGAVGSAVLLATFGATAWLVGDMADRRR